MHSESYKVTDGNKSVTSSNSSDEVERHFTLEQAELKGDLGQDKLVQWYHNLPYSIRRRIGALQERPRHGDRASRPDYLFPKVGAELEVKNWHRGYVVDGQKLQDKVTGKQWLAKHRAALWLNQVEFKYGAITALNGIRPIVGLNHLLDYLVSLAAPVNLGVSLGGCMCLEGCSCYLNSTLVEGCCSSRYCGGCSSINFGFSGTVGSRLSGVCVFHRNAGYSECRCGLVRPPDRLTERERKLADRERLDGLIAGAGLV